MIIDPATHYDASYWGAQKPYRVRHADGRIETRFYQGPSLWWDGFGPLTDAILVTLPTIRPATWLDIGCGAGCFVGFLRAHGIDAEGVDISTHAVAHARPEVAPYVALRDVLAEAIERPFAFVSALDLVEHVYARDQRNLWAAFWQATKPGGALVLDVATAHRPEEIWVAEPDAPIPIEREWQAVSGHVFVQPCDYWYGWAAALGWKLDREAMARFQAWREATPGYCDLEAWGRRNYMVMRRPP